MTECREALVVWVASTTVGAERGRLRAELSKSRGVFGVYDNATLIPEPHAFGSTPAASLLPRGARIVGWLEHDGYRSVAGMPQPTSEWLHDAAARQAPVPTYAG